MTNLEYYKDEIKKEFLKHHYLGDVVYSVASNNGYKFYRNSEDDINLIDWLLEEHKEPIKLNKLEYDLLKCYQKAEDDSKFMDYYILREMQYKGHFQDVDYNLTIEEILNNCEVIDKLREVKYESSTINR